MEKTISGSGHQPKLPVYEDIKFMNEAKGN